MNKRRDGLCVWYSLGIMNIHKLERKFRNMRRKYWWWYMIFIKFKNLNIEITTITISLTAGFQNQVEMCKHIMCSPKLKCVAMYLLEIIRCMVYLVMWFHIGKFSWICDSIWGKLRRKMKLFWPKGYDQVIWMEL